MEQPFWIYLQPPGNPQWTASDEEGHVGTGTDAASAIADLLSQRTGDTGAAPKGPMARQAAHAAGAHAAPTRPGAPRR